MIVSSAIKKNIRKIKGKTIFLRVDFNIPIRAGKIQDEKKIIATLPTLRYLLRYNCKVVLATHLGRPDGKREEKYSTKIIAKRLNKILGGKRVEFSAEIFSNDVKIRLEKMKGGKILFLENLRFDKREKKNNKQFAKELASLADFYINDAFSVSHRKHASVNIIKKFIPHIRGPLVEMELKNLDKIKNPKKPLVVVMGGAKINTKINLIKSLEKKATSILIGGALANNFFKAIGLEVGKSLIDKKSIKKAKKLISKKIILPVDVVVRCQKKGSKIKVRHIDEIEKNEIILDIGPETIIKYSKILKKAKTIIWNGPMGYFEDNDFKHGTLMIGQVICSRSDKKAFTVVGGGETIKALKLTKMQDYINWISTGGGAMLAYLGNEKMPGL